MTHVKIALLGAGTVGTQVARLLKEQAKDLEARSGAKLELIGIAVRRLDAPRDPVIDPCLLTDNPHDIIREADIVIELMGGIEPARSLILEAFESGASVVTGNKALLAAHGPELYEAAKRADVDVYYEAAVAGAVPVVYGLRESLAGDRITAVVGIVNGTTNYILDEMTTTGVSFQEALSNAQKLGYAEADPSADVDGLDAAAKCAILASLAFHSRVSLDDVHVHGIRHITQGDIESAARSSSVVKLIASAKRREHGIELHVGPTLIPMEHPLASVRGAYNAIVIEAESAQRLMFYGPGAGGAPTASAVLSDIVAAAAHKVSGGHAPRELIYEHLPVLDASQGRSSFQAEFAVRDNVGVLAHISRIFAENNVSIRSVHQRPSHEGYARLTVVTHEAQQDSMEKTLASLVEGGHVSEVHNVSRVEEA